MRDPAAVRSSWKLLGAATLLAIPSWSEEANELSLSDLMDLNVATLIKTDPNDVPATTYSWTSEELQASGAQTLTDFLQSRVPGSYTMEHTWVTPLWGFRGVMNDRSENVLMSVNGESQNLLSKVGVQGDAVLGLHEDVARLDVIAGPGSVVYGGGALSGVVSLQLKDGVGEKSTQTLMTIRSDKGGSAEAAQVFKWEGEKYLRLSGGFSYAEEESDGYRSQNILAGIWEFNNPNFVHTGRVFGPNQRLTAVYTDVPNRFKAWARYTGAEFNSNYLKDVEADAVSGVDNGVGGIVLSRRHFHKNLSAATEWTLPLAEELSMKWTLAHTEAASGIERARSGTIFSRDTQLTYDGTVLDGIGEMRSRLRGDLIFDNKSHPAVLATEFRHDLFGNVPLFPEASTAHPDEYPNNQLGGKTIADVQYTNLALIGEYQGRFLDQFIRPTLGIRYDRHTHSETYAPRVALTRSFQDKHFLRASWQKSYKALSADNLEGNVEVSDPKNLPGHDQEPSSNQTMEVGYNFEGTALRIKTALYRNDLILYTWNDALKRQSENKLATQGGEISVGWKAATWGAEASHSTVRLPEVEREANGELKSRSFTIDGDHLLNYLEDITRLQAFVDATSRLRLSAQAQVWWPFTGRDQIADWREEYAAAHPAGDSLHVEMKDISWIRDPQVKLNLAARLLLANGSVTLRLDNVSALWDMRNEGRPAYDAGGSDGQFSQSVVYLVDVPRARLDWAAQF